MFDEAHVHLALDSANIYQLLHSLLGWMID